MLVQECILTYGAIKSVSNFYIDNIFSEDDISNLVKLYDKCKNERVKRLHNLFYLDYRSIPSELSSPYKEILEKEFNLRADRMYFLNYVPGSFTRCHVDVGEQSQRTVITLIEQPEETEGGETIVYTDHYKKNNFEFDVNRYKRESDEDDAQGHPIVPHVINLKVGQSAVYDAQTRHEVAEVTKGNRKVLVSWLL